MPFSFQHGRVRIFGLFADAVDHRHRQPTRAGTSGQWTVVVIPARTGVTAYPTPYVRVRALSDVTWLSPLPSDVSPFFFFTPLVYHTPRVLPLRGVQGGVMRESTPKVPTQAAAVTSFTSLRGQGFFRFRPQSPNRTCQSFFENESMAIWTLTLAPLCWNSIATGSNGVAARASVVGDKRAYSIFRPQGSEGLMPWHARHSPNLGAIARGGPGASDRRPTANAQGRWPLHSESLT